MPLLCSSVSMLCISLELSMSFFKVFLNINLLYEVSSGYNPIQSRLGILDIIEKHQLVPSSGSDKELVPMLY